MYIFFTGDTSMKKHMGSKSILLYFYSKKYLTCQEIFFYYRENVELSWIPNPIIGRVRPALASPITLYTQTDSQRFLQRAR